MNKLIFCGPRGFWLQPDGTIFTQVIKRYEDGTKFVLQVDGTWREFKPGEVFTREDTFVSRKIYDSKNWKGEGAVIFTHDENG